MARKLKTRYGMIGVAAIAVAAVAVVASAAWAAIPDASGTIHACADRDGRLRVIDTELGKTCKSSERRLSWPAAAPPPPPPAAQLPDAFVALRTSGAPVPSAPGEFIEIARLELPAGNYAVTAKADVQSNGSAGDPAVQVFCKLHSGAPVDDFVALKLAPVSSPGESESLSLLTTKELSAAGSVSLSCGAEGNVAGIEVEHTVVRAVEVGSITTDPGIPPLP